MNLLSTDIRGYVGRTVDLLAFDEATPSGMSLLRQSLVFAGSRGALTTGIQKLAQRFLLELLTEQGSLRYLPDAGSLFMHQIASGALQTNEEIISAFIIAENGIRRKLRSEIRESDPLDERYVLADNVTASRTPDSVSLGFRILTEGGNSVGLIYPLRVNNTY